MMTEDVSTSFITSKICSIEVYDNFNCYDSDEEVELRGYNDQNGTILIQNGNDVCFKDKSLFGRSENHEIQLKDLYVSGLHCKLEWDNWFRKKRLWVKQHELLLRIRELPASIVRNIIEFIKEPRYVKLVDVMSWNGTLVALKTGKDVKLEKKQKYRFGEILDMSVKQQDMLELTEEESLERVDKKLEENSQAITFTDFLKAEEGDNRKYHFFSMKVNLRGQKNASSMYFFASNKKESRWLIGGSMEADICIQHENLDDFQCEIVQKDGSWYIVEWQHDSPRKRTYLALNEKNKEYIIKENTDFRIGKTSFSLTFPNMIQPQEQEKNQLLMNSTCSGSSLTEKK